MTDDNSLKTGTMIVYIIQTFYWRKRIREQVSDFEEYRKWEEVHLNIKLGKLRWYIELMCNI